MKRILVLLLACVMLAASACAKGVEPDALAGRTFKWEKDGFGGDFTISLFEDGTYRYYEGYLSSYIGFGNWTLKDGVLTLTETGGYDFVFRFAVKDGALVYLADGSSRFLYTDVQDGDRFLPLP